MEADQARRAEAEARQREAVAGHAARTLAHERLDASASSSMAGHLQSIGLGLSLGMFHAMLGPDHVSALLTLAVNRRPCAAAWLGVRWGVGHSVGLLAVTGVVIFLRDVCAVDQDRMVSLVEHGMDWVVGVIMVLLGLWGYRRAGRMRGATLLLGESVELDCVDNVHDHSGHEDAALQRDTPAVEVSRARCRGAVHRSLLAVGVGVLHGLGGPGGVLAVLPTLFIPSVLGAALYLGAFCLSTTLTMAALASVYGACTHRSHAIKPGLPWVLQCASATISVCVGILWLMCSATGTLGDVLSSLGLE